MNEELDPPLRMDLLPESIRRFCDPAAPKPARMMAARGLVAVRGADQLILLVQLASDPDTELAKTARAALDSLPRVGLLQGCASAVPTAILHRVAEWFPFDREVLEQIVLNKITHDETFIRIATECDELLGELIAGNEQRLLAAPRVIEALYKNKKVRMSTVDRLVELAARHRVELHGVSSYKAHVEAISGQLLPEASAEPLPSDLDFQEALKEDADDPDAIVIDPIDGSEELKDGLKPLSFRISKMSTAEKVRLAVVGNAAARALLVRDRNKLVSQSAIASPSMTELEAVGIARSREVGEDILRFIGHNRREWLRSYELKRALCFNPKTPVGISLGLIAHMHDADLRNLSRGRGVSGPVKAAATQRLIKKNKR